LFENCLAFRARGGRGETSTHNERAEQMSRILVRGNTAGDKKRPKTIEGLVRERGATESWEQWESAQRGGRNLQKDGAKYKR